MSGAGTERLRLLVVPGLHDSGPAHWQSWLQSLHRDAVRVVQDDWHDPDLDRWSSRLLQAIDHDASARWIVAAHSFGCLALLHAAARRPDLPLASALLVAPADPDRFGLGDRLAAAALPCPGTLVASTNDPWLAADRARTWARRWGTRHRELGAVGHINAEAGFGPLPLAQRWVVASRQHAHRRRHAGATARVDAAPGAPAARHGFPRLSPRP